MILETVGVKRMETDRWSQLSISLVHTQHFNTHLIPRDGISEINEGDRPERTASDW